MRVHRRWAQPLPVVAERAAWTGVERVKIREHFRGQRVHVFQGDCAVYGYHTVASKRRQSGGEAAGRQLPARALFGCHGDGAQLSSWGVRGHRNAGHRRLRSHRTSLGLAAAVHDAGSREVALLAPFQAQAAVRTINLSLPAGVRRWHVVQCAWARPARAGRRRIHASIKLGDECSQSFCSAESRESSMVGDRRINSQLGRPE